jgi:hypothetical protein
LENCRFFGLPKNFPSTIVAPFSLDIFQRLKNALTDGSLAGGNFFFHTLCAKHLSYGN